MHIYNLDKWKYQHDFNTEQSFGEKRTLLVMILTLVTMFAEIIGGMVYHSMALLADGWHMSTHVLAFAITLFAYHYTKKHKNSENLTFSTGKVGSLGGFASAVSLGVVALFMIIESIERFVSPETILFNQAILVCVIGLVVNGASVFLLGHNHDHHHGEGHEHHNHHDHNLKAAYYHVLADTFTSLLAIFALLAGKYYQLNWMDPLMGIVGAVVIGKWALGLIKENSNILLDSELDNHLKSTIYSVLENYKDTRVVDYHAWKLSPQHSAMMVSIVTHYPEKPDFYKDLIHNHCSIDHITVEVNGCDGPSCVDIKGNQPMASGK